MKPCANLRRYPFHLDKAQEHIGGLAFRKGDPIVKPKAPGGTRGMWARKC